MRWYFTASITVAVALPLIAVVVALIAGINLTAALLPVAEIEFWWSIFLWLPLAAIGLFVCLVVRAIKSLPWVAQDT